MANENEPSVMAAYFDMMRQFLDTQERIMSMHMSGGISAPARRGAEGVPRHMPNQAYGYSGAGPEPGFASEETVTFKPEIPYIVPEAAPPTPPASAPGAGERQNVGSGSSRAGKTRVGCASC